MSDAILQPGRNCWRLDRVHRFYAVQDAADTAAHRPDEPPRVTPLDTVYGPYHEVQTNMEGPAAASLGALVRDRWRAVGAARLPPMGRSEERLWPADITPDFTDVEAVISRTVPGSTARLPCMSVRRCSSIR